MPREVSLHVSVCFPVNEVEVVNQRQALKLKRSLIGRVLKSAFFQRLR